MQSKTLHNGINNPFSKYSRRMWEQSEEEGGGKLEMRLDRWSKPSEREGLVDRHVTYDVKQLSPTFQGWSLDRRFATADVKD